MTTPLRRPRLEVSEMASTRKRVAGHTLAFEGAPHHESGARFYGPFEGVSGEGRAKCSCGELSDVLSSGAKRKAWHREHKAMKAAER